MNDQLPARSTDQPPKLPTIIAGGEIRAIVPNDLDSAWRIANVVVKSGMAPAGLQSAEKCMVAIMHGLEVGMPPMMAVQSIAVINGRPSIFGDGALGLCQSSGLMEWYKERYEGEEGKDDYLAYCQVKRKGDQEIKTAKFSIADAKRAGLWGKSGPWTQYWPRMLKMRARAFALRDGFSDVLRGLHIIEEAQDIPIRDITDEKWGDPPRPPQLGKPESNASGSLTGPAASTTSPKAAGPTPKPEPEEADNGTEEDGSAAAVGRSMVANDKSGSDRKDPADDHAGTGADDGVAGEDDGPPRPPATDRATPDQGDLSPRGDTNRPAAAAGSAAKAKAPRAPFSADDPDTILKWVEAELSKVTPEDYAANHDCLHDLWETKIKPKFPADMFPPDYQECVGAWRKHYKRISS